MPAMRSAVASADDNPQSIYNWAENNTRKLGENGNNVFEQRCLSTVRDSEIVFFFFERCCSCSLGSAKLLKLEIGLFSIFGKQKNKVKKKKET